MTHKDKIFFFKKVFCDHLEIKEVNHEQYRVPNSWR